MILRKKEKIEERNGLEKRENILNIRIKEEL
jgi:hypothetical protein